MREISKEELAEGMKKAEQIQRETIDAYLANPQAFEIEIRLVSNAAKDQGFNNAGKFIAASMIWLHTMIEKETGQRITRRDTGLIPKLQ